MQNVVNQHCSICGRQGHNILTCDLPDIIDFENRTHEVSVVFDENLFRLWLTTNYGTNLDLLQRFVERNCTVEVLYADPAFYIYEIVQYFYGNNLMTGLDDLPDLIPVTEIEHYSRDQILSLLELKNKDIPLQEDEVVDCSICFECKKRENMVVFECNHEFCKDCTIKIIRTYPFCPCCRAKINKVTTFSIDTKKEMTEKLISYYY